MKFSGEKQLKNTHERLILFNYALPEAFKKFFTKINSFLSPTIKKRSGFKGMAGLLKQ